MRHKKGAGAHDEAPAGASSSSYNTIKPNPKPTYTYATRMTLAFAGTALMTVVVLALVLAYVWTGQFQKYARENMQRTADSMSSAMAQQYESDGRWSGDAMESVRHSAELMNDVGVQLLDVDGTVLFDDTNLPRIDSGRGTTTAPPSAESVVSSDVITSAGQKVGTLRFYAMGSDAFFTKSDSAFRANSFGAIFSAGCVALVLACLIGYFVSRALTRPLKRITTTASQIRNGNLSARTGLAGRDEIGQLA